jgi:hypothetical protein
MNDLYIVSFIPGTSGRFVSSIIWSLINNLDVNIEYTKHNSAHTTSHWALSWANQPVFTTDVYKKIEFSDSPSPLNPYGNKLLNTHVFPDWDTIRQRFPNAKIVVLSYTENDFLEITGNALLKNGFDGLEKTPPHDTLYTRFILNCHRKLYGREYDYTKITTNEIREISLEYYIYEKQFLPTRPFRNPVIPPDFVDTTLVLSYNDLFTMESEQYKGLSSLANFTDTIVSDSVQKMYEKYVDGRDKLIKEKMPWILL